jgi:RNA polymerase sigma factor (TIGR02999 family)
MLLTQSMFRDNSRYDLSMKSNRMSELTQILERVESGDRLALDELLPCVYSELRQLAAAQLRHEKPGNSLQATALVHEAYLRLVDGSNSQNLTNRRYFFGAAAQAMRRILVEQARRKARVKHGGELERVDLPEISAAPSDRELILLDDALSRLQAEDSIAAEIVQLKFFAGVGRDSIAEMLGLSVHEVRAKWAYAQAWLKVALEE